MKTQTLQEIYRLLAIVGLIAAWLVAGTSRAATYNFYFNNTEQGANSTATPTLITNGDGKITTPNTSPSPLPSQLPTPASAPLAPPVEASHPDVSPATDEAEQGERSMGQLESYAQTSPRAGSYPAFRAEFGVTTQRGNSLDPKYLPNAGGIGRRGESNQFGAKDAYASFGFFPLQRIGVAANLGPVIRSIELEAVPYISGSQRMQLATLLGVMNTRIGISRSVHSSYLNGFSQDETVEKTGATPHIGARTSWFINSNLGLAINYRHTIGRQRDLKAEQISGGVMVHL